MTIAVLLSLILILSACQLQEESKNPPIFTGAALDQGEKAIITGKISNRDVYPHVKWLEISLLDFYGNETKHSSPLAEDGMFHFEIYPVTTREISFVPVEDRIVIAPGDSLYIKKDFRNITHTIFRGTNAELNTYINAFLNQYLGRYNQPYELSFTDFRADAKKQYDETLHKLATFEQEQAKRKIASLQLPGVHVALTDKEWQDIIKRFNTKSIIPYYLLFDKKGVMVDFGLHLRPGNSSTKESIQKLLND